LEQIIKKIDVPVIVSELQLFLIHKEFPWIYAVIFHQPFFVKRSETFDTVDADFSISESFAMIDTPVFESIRDKSVIDSESIRTVQTLSSDFLHS
jgi:hypothetical protein